LRAGTKDGVQGWRLGVMCYENDPKERPPMNVEAYHECSIAHVAEY
jgi:hypothetical protein